MPISFEPLRAVSWSADAFVPLGGAASPRRVLRLLLAARRRYPQGRPVVRCWRAFGAVWLSVGWSVRPGSAGIVSASCALGWGPG